MPHSPRPRRRELQRAASLHGTYSMDARFKEMNKVESVESGVLVRSLSARDGVFLLYAPSRVGRKKVGSRAVFPETVFVLPRQPNVAQVLGDSRPFTDFMLQHFFTFRRGFDLNSSLEKLIDDGEAGVTFQPRWDIEIDRNP